jgi:DNA polymerase sigma
VLQVERVLHARVPVIKFKHKGTGLECDVSINRPECTFKANMQK